MPLWTPMRDPIHRAPHRLTDGEERPSPLPPPYAVDPRDVALAKMLWSAPLAAVTLLAVYALSQWGRFDAGFKLLGLLVALPLVPFLVHGTEVVTNVRFLDLSARWHELAGWQRGLLGTTLVVLAAAAILCLAFAVGMDQAGLWESVDAGPAG